MQNIKTVTDLSIRIRSRRKDLGLTQADAAGLCGVGLRLWSELENGKQSLQVGKILSVLERLGIRLSK